MNEVKKGDEINQGKLAKQLIRYMMVSRIDCLRVHKTSKEQT